MFSVAQWNLCDILQQIIQQTKPRGKFSLSEQSFEMKPFNKPCHTLLSGQPQTLYSTDCILKDVSLDTCKKRCLDQEYPIHDCISAIANNKQNNECNYLQVEKKVCFSQKNRIYSAPPPPPPQCFPHLQVIGSYIARY